MKSLRVAIRAWFEDIGIITTASVFGCALGAGIGCGVGTFYCVVKLFVVLTERIFQSRLRLKVLRLPFLLNCCWRPSTKRCSPQVMMNCAL